MKKLCEVLAVALLLSGVAVANSAAQENSRERAGARLRGLGGVHVEVAPFQLAGDAADSHPERALRADVEHQLRAAGIAVLTEQEWAKTSDKPALRISIHREPDGSRWIKSSVRLEQEVVLPRDHSVSFPATTWSVVGLALVSVGETPEKKLNTFRSLIAGPIGMFIDDYRSVNPDQATGASPASKNGP